LLGLTLSLFYGWLFEGAPGLPALIAAISWSLPSFSNSCSATSMTEISISILIDVRDALSLVSGEKGKCFSPGDPAYPKPSSVGMLRCLNLGRSGAALPGLNGRTWHRAV